MKTADSNTHGLGRHRAAGFSVAEARLDNGGVVLSIGGELDIVTAPALRERAVAVIETGVRRLVLDLTAVSFMDSTALAVVIAVKTRLGDAGHLTLVIPPDSYARLILEVVGLVELLDVVETLEAGIERVTRQ